MSMNDSYALWFDSNKATHDRAYGSSDLRGFFKALIKTGVLGRDTNELLVTAQEDMKVKMSAGMCFILGAIRKFPDTEFIIPYGEEYDRYDCIVLQFNLEQRNILALHIKGEASILPKKYQPIQTDTIYELPLCYISVEANSTSVTQAEIEDLRGTGLCPYAFNLLTEVDTSGLFKQYQAAWDLLVAGMELDEPNIIKAFESLNVAKTINSVAPVNGNVPLSLDNIYSGKDYPKYTVQCGTISGTETTDVGSPKYEVNVVYPKPFKSKPTVVATLVDGGGDYGDYSTHAIVIRNETAEGFTIRIQDVNRYILNWIAVGDFVPEWEGAVPDAELTHVETGQMHSLTKEEIARAFNKGGN